MKRIAWLSLLLPVLMGCAQVQGDRVQVDLAKPAIAESRGPADYYYARAHRNHDEALMIDELIRELHKEIRTDKVLQRRYLDKAAEVGPQTGTLANIRQAEYRTYITEARLLDERISRLRTAAAALRTQYGRLVSEITVAEQRGNDLEQGDVLAGLP